VRLRKVTRVAAVALLALLVSCGRPAEPPLPGADPSAVGPVVAAPITGGPSLREPSDLSPPSSPPPATAAPSVERPARAPRVAGPTAEPEARRSAPEPADKPAGRMLDIYLTGYSFHDNTPPGSASICCPVLHDVADGTGTFQDPITVAVPGSGSGMEWPPGTKFYLPTLKRYLIVEDSGAGATPAGVDTHLDVWVGGEGGSKSAVDARMRQITGNVPAELNPPPGRPVTPGPIFSA
jgi:hypothetical protein